MPILLLAFLIGCVTGLRSMMGPALVCWAAHFGWLHFEGTRLGFLHHAATLLIFSLLALGELVADKLPKTPSRTALFPLSARVVLGAACGCALAINHGSGAPLCGGLGAVGAVAGAFAGYNARRTLVAMHWPDLVVAILEDAIAIVGGLLIISRV